METSEPLSIESFSYSWLSNIKRPSIDSLDDPSRPSPGKTPATNPPEKSQDNFNFHIAISHTQASFVDADDIFSNGIIRPAVVGNPNHGTLPTVKTRKPSNSVVQRDTFPHVRWQLLWKWRKSSGRIIQKWFSYIKMPLCYNAEGCRRKTSSGTRAYVGAGRRFQEVHSCNSSPQQSPAQTSHPVGHLSDDESSIYEAVLHCKRSIGRRFYET